LDAGNHPADRSFIPGNFPVLSRYRWYGQRIPLWMAGTVVRNLAELSGWDQPGGQAAFRWVWKDTNPLTWQRLIGTAIGAVVPLIILLLIGVGVPVGSAGTRFYDLEKNNWQPILTQASLFTAIVGFYIPGVLYIDPKSTWIS
jgi:hypothetical protein